MRIRGVSCFVCRMRTVDAGLGRLGVWWEFWGFFCQLDGCLGRRDREMPAGSWTCSRLSRSTTRGCCWLVSGGVFLNKYANPCVVLFVECGPWMIGLVAWVSGGNFLSIGRMFGTPGSGDAGSRVLFNSAFLYIYLNPWVLGTGEPCYNVIIPGCLAVFVSGEHWLYVCVWDKHGCRCSRSVGAVFLNPRTIL
jgi:hypothetical protein